MKDRLVVIVGYTGAELLDISCVATSLDVANRIGAKPRYRIRLATPGGAAIASDSGLALQGQENLEQLKGPIDTLVVSGGLKHRELAATPRFVGDVRRLAAVSRRVASVCTGASVLAAAGLLDGKRATTHWRYASRLAAEYPQVDVDSAPIYITDGKVSTSAGVTSALDLTLSFIEADHGAELARWVSRALVTYLHRPGNQTQMSMFTAAPPSDHALVRQVTEYITENLGGDLSATVLAALVNVSERHLGRLFEEHVGDTPGRYVRKNRLAAAAQLLTSTSLPMSRIADRCGFGTPESLRQAFTIQYGIAPSRYRATQAKAA